MKKAIPALILVLVVWVLWANTAIEVNEWVIESPQLPPQFDGFRIAQISDLHNAEFGAQNEKLLKLLAESEPELIVITGDMIDSRNTDVETALSFAEMAVEIAPCYYVSGNHESRVDGWVTLRQGLVDAGVIVLDDEKTTLERDGQAITLIGLSDPDFRQPFADHLRALTASEEGYTILLSHRPESFGLYISCGVDLVFSGHAHGGQVRIPFVGGLVAPHQGFFPEYVHGFYEKNKIDILISSGLGSGFAWVPRFNNPPEVVVLTLIPEK